MSETTGIAWTESTWNPWMGCDKVSRGCKFCYMFREQARYGNDPKEVRRSKTKFNDPLKWKEPKLIFTCSWSDWFHEKADAWRAEAWDIIRRSPQHTFQILTKRPERILSNLPDDWGNGYDNVWLGVSIEDDGFLHRMFTLSHVPAVVRFISAEPLLAPLSLRGALSWPCRFLPESQQQGRSDMNTPLGVRRQVDWVIVGGESGEHAREMRIEWARELRDACAEAGVPFFLKQLGGPAGNARAKDEAVLDGNTHTEMPSPWRVK